MRDQYLMTGKMPDERSFLRRFRMPAIDKRRDALQRHRHDASAGHGQGRCGTQRSRIPTCAAELANERTAEDPPRKPLTYKNLAGRR